MSVYTARHAASPRVSRWLVIVAAVALIAAGGIVAGIVSQVWAAPIDPVDTYEVNSLGRASDADLNDKTCDTGNLASDGAPECTLRAALEQANHDDDYDAITVAEGFAGGDIVLDATTYPTSAYMLSSDSTGVDPISDGAGGEMTSPEGIYTKNGVVYAAVAVDGDAAAVFAITQPVTIDLKHKIHVAPIATNDGIGAALVFINSAGAPGVMITGWDNSYTSESTFYIGPNAANVTIDGGTDNTVTTSNPTGLGTSRTQDYFPERFVVVRGGAANITVKNWIVSGYAGNGSTWASTVIGGANDEAHKIDGLTLTNMHYDMGGQGSNDCGGSVGQTACSFSVIYTMATAQWVDKLSFTDSFVDKLNFNGSYSLLDLRYLHSSSVTIDNNQITDAKVTGDPLVDVSSATIGKLTFSGNTLPNLTGSGPALLNLTPAATTITKGVEFNGNTITAAVGTSFTSRIIDASPVTITGGGLQFNGNIVNNPGGVSFTNFLVITDGSTIYGPVSIDQNQLTNVGRSTDVFSLVSTNIYDDPASGASGSVQFTNNVVKGTVGTGGSLLYMPGTTQISGSLKMNGNTISDTNSTDHDFFLTGLTVPVVEFNNNTITNATTSANYLWLGTVNATTSVTVDSNSFSTLNVSGGDSNAFLDFETLTTPILNITGTNTFTDVALASSTPLINLGGGSQITSMFTMSGATATNIAVTTGGAGSPIELTTSTLKEIDISDNRFTGITTTGNADAPFLSLPDGKTTSGKIDNNVMIATQGKIPAISWTGVLGASLDPEPTPPSGGAYTSSGVEMRYNYFDGWGSNPTQSTVRLTGTGAVTFAENTFGPDTTTQTNTVEEEAVGTSLTANGNTGTTMFNNLNLRANGKLDTWLPTATTQANVQNPVDATGCQVSLEVGVPSTYGVQVQNAWMPSPPVLLDVFWTIDNTAELWLGSFEVLTSASQAPDPDCAAADHCETVVSKAFTAVLPVKLPTSTTDARYDELKEVFGGQLPSTLALPVDASGTVQGGLRVQSHVHHAYANPSPGQTDAQSRPLQTLASSQYSRVAKLAPSSCAPSLTINQAAVTANIPTDKPVGTMSRFIPFTLTSSMELDFTTLTASDISLNSTGPGAGSAILVDPGTKAPLGPNDLISMSGDRLSANLMVKVDDTTLVTVAVAAGAVATPTGLASTTASTSEVPYGNQVQFTNPLSVVPATFPVVLGDTEVVPYDIQIDPAASPPTADLTFTATPPTGDTVPYTLTLSPATPTIGAGAMALTTPVEVKAEAKQGQSVADATVATITHTVTSTDPYYNGLVAPSAQAYLYATNPMVEIVKQAYIGVTDFSTPQRIMDTGTQVAAGDTIEDGTPTWFVFRVHNISTDSWQSELTDVTVTDDVLGTITPTPITLAVGETRYVSLDYNHHGPYIMESNQPATDGGQ